MKTLVVSSLFAFLLSVSKTAADGPTFYFDGILDLANAFSEKGAPAVNRLRRSDSLFDNIRFTLSGDAVLSDRLTLFNQIILDPTSKAHVSSYFRSYVRYTAYESAKADLHFEAGKIPTVFGAFGPRAYSDRNPLVSAPLIYHYFTSLRSNQLPADNADLLAHRGEGPFDAFGGFAGGGSSLGFNGLPIIYDVCWDVGVKAFGSAWRLEYQAAVTQGTLSDPRNSGGDNNDGKQIAFRIGLVPLTGLIIGASYAQGPYLDQSVGEALQGQDVEDFAQQVAGLDLELGIRHLKVIGELIFNHWEVPNITDEGGNRTDLTNVGGYIEAKYAFRPGLYGAVRYDRLTFGEIHDETGGKVPWDEPIQRWEWGIGYYLHDGVIAKVLRQDIRVEHLNAPDSVNHFWATQLSVSF